MLFDAERFYVSNLKVYCGRQSEAKDNLSKTPTEIVLRLGENVKGSNRYITCHNWYSSYPLDLYLDLG